MGTFVIDGQEVQADPNKTVLEIAQELGLNIPTLCYHKSLSPYGACRICTVEIIWGKRSRLITACTYPAWEGMEVKTNSEKVIRARKLLLELKLAEAPGSPEIKKLAHEYGVEKTEFKVVGDEDNRCIMCGLCVRICEDVMGIGAIGFKNRGDRREITPPLEEYSDVCSTCGACVYVCPTGAIKLEEFTDRKPIPIPSEFDAGLTSRPCIYTPFPQAVPNKPVIDRENCMFFKTGDCRICESVCQPQAIKYDQEDIIIEEEVGAVVVATGFDLYPMIKLGEYGGGKIKNVIDGLAFERMLSASGPTQGEVRRPSDGVVPKEVVFIQCAGSRDPEQNLPYCSKICCMYTTKHAMLYKHRVPDGQPYVFYIDMRTGGKGYEEFYQRAIDEDDVVFLRGKVSKIYEEDGKVVVWGADTLTGKKVEIRADMAVLAMGIVPSEGTDELVRKLKIGCGDGGFLTEAHPKLRPVESMSAGFFLAGCAQAPKDIPEVVAQASGAASKVAALFSQERLYHEPIVAVVDEDICSGCKICIPMCPYEAREFDEEKKIVSVKEVLCEGCGACVAACPSGATQQRNLRDDQIFKMIEAGVEVT
ncbi:4Fe-4S binding protein [candidate division KSB1 bacterium]|nr:4Fe-4S binding protein [candidate division KSB1 bacterium]